MIWVSLPTCFAMTVLGMHYKAPDADLNFADELRRPLTTIHEGYAHDNILLFGDLNFPDINWSTLTSLSTESRRFLDVCLDFNLE